ncbi:Putative ribonuclease P/MRP protein subunit Pop1 [Septoria linicola]|uniref:Ribonuclease P/MRP protein subunit Pop1 n=1 Tax=Septoria linicola TaxID=215465 RepID=A0A9Q9AII2_9PEZI|nr:Putative ribonuclease P/MRP protein subunit Pop1 [Septoria linicola]
MAQESAPKPTAAGNAATKKRKEPPTNGHGPRGNFKRPKSDHRAKQRDARLLATQTSSKAFKNGQLDVDNFVKSREYEIRALEEGISRSRQALTKRAFQQVPKELRRRTASHNVKRVPKRLQPRAKREMAEDNTPTVTSKSRKPTRHMRLRLETVKKLRAMGAKRKFSKELDTDVKVTVCSVPDSSKPEAGTGTPVAARAPKVKKAKLAVPPKPKAKFRKRQIDKTWLPTHMFHAKRARMTASKEALWRFAIPLTPTAKSYRPTHRSAKERGAIAWDMSYMSTIGLEGQQRSIEGVLQALRFSLMGNDSDPWGPKSHKWQNGSRACHGFVFEREAPHKPLAPVTVIWFTSLGDSLSERDEEATKRKRKLLMRVHPSAFAQLWEEVVRLGRVAKPQVAVEDLRYELGSIEVTGPSATEALLGALLPAAGSEAEADDVAKVWTGLAGLTDTSLLPPNIAMSFDVQDPRLRHPPQTIKLPQTAEEQQRLIELTASWPLDESHASSRLFDRRARQRASSALSSQKSINRRKAAAAPGQFPDPVPEDPRIPVLAYTTSPSRGKDGSWTVLLPWKCVQPVWYSIMFYPLSIGGQPRFGGLDEKRQLAFESNQPWFPGDYAGTQAGWNWELEQRKKRKDDWERRPKSKRVNWEAVQVSAATKGEIGVGWACDWERLIDGPAKAAPPSAESDNNAKDSTMPDAGTTSVAAPVEHSLTPRITFIPSREAERLFRSTMNLDLPPTLLNPTITISLSCLARGTPQTCARIYRLPSAASSSDLRKQWLALHPRHRPNKTGPKNSLPRLPKDAPAHVVQRRLARSLLEPARAGEDEYPSCPEEEDLIGFVTTGNLNLSEGRGTGIGNILLSRVLEDVRRSEDDGRLCIVRNAGQSIGRLAKWTLA